MKILNNKKIIIGTVAFISIFSVTLSAQNLIPDEQDMSFDTLKYKNKEQGEFSRELLRENKYFPTDWDNNLSTNTEVKVDESGNSYLSIFSPKGSYGTKTSGAQVELSLNPGKEYYMSYDMMFDENFSWGGEYKGGKLPGLTAGKRCSGECDGTDGFAARFMWRREGEGELYLCHLDQVSEENCDDYYFTNPDGTRFKFKKGQKYNIEEYVRLNSGPNNYDGQIIVRVDGVEVLNLEGIRLVTDDDLIDTFYLSMFYGGSSTKWQATTDSYFYFDNLELKKLS